MDPLSGGALRLLGQSSAGRKSRKSTADQEKGMAHRRQKQSSTLA